MLRLLPSQRRLSALQLPLCLVPRLRLLPVLLHLLWMLLCVLCMLPMLCVVAMLVRCSPPPSAAATNVRRR